MAQYWHGKLLGLVGWHHVRYLFQMAHHRVIVIHGLVALLSLQNKPHKVADLKRRVPITQNKLENRERNSPMMVTVKSKLREVLLNQ